MFYHVKELQYNAKPDRPDAVYAKKLQEMVDNMELRRMMNY